MSEPNLGKYFAATICFVGAAGMAILDFYGGYYLLNKWHKLDWMLFVITIAVVGNFFAWIAALFVIDDY